MTITRRAHGAATAWTTSQAVAYSASATAGDTCVLVALNAAAIGAAPAGWTELASANAAGVYGKVFALNAPYASQGTPTVTASGGSGGVAWIEHWYSDSADLDVAATFATDTDTTSTAFNASGSSITTLTGDVLAYALALKSAATMTAGPTGITGTQAGATLGAQVGDFGARLSGASPTNSLHYGVYHRPVTTGGSGIPGMTATSGTGGGNAGGLAAVIRIREVASLVVVDVDSDNVNAGDIAATAVAATRTPADQAGLSDSVSAIVSAVRTIADSASLIDTPTEQTLATSLPIDDAAGIADAATALAAASRAITDAAGIADAASATILALTEATVTDAAGLADVATPATSATRGPAEASGIADQAAATLATVRAPADQAGLSDSVTVTIVSAGDALVVDPLGTVDQVTVTITSARSIADAAALTDAVAANLTSDAMPDDAIALGDTVTASLSAARGTSEAVGVLDQITAYLLARGETADQAGVGDQVSTLVDRTRQVDDLAELSDTIGTLAVSVRTLTDAGEVTDVVTAVLATAVAPLGRTLLIYYERHYRPGWRDTFEHDPQARLDYTWDWTDWLDGDTIASATVTADVDEGRDPASVVVVGDTWPGPRAVTAWISGGVHGTPCVVTCRIVTTAGRTDDRTIRLRVRNR